MANKSSVLDPELSAIPPVAAPTAEIEEQLTAERLAQENRRHDRVLAGLVFLLGFLLASFPVGNSDIWVHLRTGQLIASGEYRFGVDPFAYTTKDANWINHSWLTDLLFYGIYALANGAGLVLLRGLLMVALLALMYRTCHSRGSLLVAVVCIGLAALTLSHRLLLRSEIVSFVMLALTMYLLFHLPVKPEAAVFERLVGWTRGRLWVFLPLVFLFWANLDAWFFLGPITVALYLLGDLITQSFGRVTYRAEALSPAERKSLGVVLLAGLLACLLNPFLHRVFELPGEMRADALSEFKSYESRLYEMIAMSPFNPRYFGGESRFFRPRGLSIAQWSYYPLVLLGILSFAVNLRRLSWSRLLIWLGFFGLSFYEVHNTGFFAVVAGPLTALNLQDWLVQRFGALPSIERRRVAGAQVGRIGVLLILVGLIALTLYPYEDPQDKQRGAVSLVNVRGSPGWSMITDASYSQCCRQMREWREAGLLTGRPFFFDWKVQANYAAWFDPPSRPAGDTGNTSANEGRVFLDMRYTLYSGKTYRDFFDAAKKLAETLQDPTRMSDKVWQNVFTTYDISHLVVSTSQLVTRPDPSDPRRVRRITESLVGLLLQDRDENRRYTWELLRYIDGRTAILAWTGSPHWGTAEKPGPLRELRYKPVQEAFHSPRLVSPDELRPAIRPSGLRAWLAGEVRQPPLAAAEAAWHIDRARIRAEWDQQFTGIINFAVHLLRIPLFPAAGPFPGAGGSVAAGYAGLTPTLATPPTLAPEPEAEILLAIRAARRALAVQPDNADAWLQLHQAYSFWQDLRIEPALSPLSENRIRRLQLAATLRSATLLQPDDFRRQAALARIYFQNRHLDLAFRHYRAAVEQLLAEGPPTEFNGTREQFEKSIAQGFQRGYGFRPLEEVERGLREQQANFNLKINTVSSLLEAANIAQESHLAEERRQYLEKALQEFPHDRSEYHIALPMLIDLYMDVGDLAQAHKLLTLPEYDAEAILGTKSHRERSIAVEAGLGYYQVAGDLLVELDEIMKKTSVEEALTGLDLQTLGGDSFRGLQFVIGYEPRYQGGIGSRGAQWVPQRVGLWYQIGLLALEAGDLRRATECFRRAAEDFDSESAYRPLALRYYRLLTEKPEAKKMVSGE